MSQSNKITLEVNIKTGYHEREATMEMFSDFSRSLEENNVQVINYQLRSLHIEINRNASFSLLSYIRNNYKQY